MQYCNGKRSSIVNFLQDYVGRERDALKAAGESLPCSSENQEHHDTVREYATFLLSVPQAGPIEMKWDQFERCGCGNASLWLYLHGQDLARHLQKCTEGWS